MSDGSDNDMHIEKIGVQLFWVEVECYRHIKAAIEHIEANGMTVQEVTPISDFDHGGDSVYALRAAVIRVSTEARESLRTAV